MSAELKKKYVYTFGGGTAEGDRSMKELLGGKGANLAEMSSIGLPVPAGFTISTVSCNYYSKNGREWPEGLSDEIKEGISSIENEMGLIIETQIKNGIHHSRHGNSCARSYR